VIRHTLCFPHVRPLPSPKGREFGRLQEESLLVDRERLRGKVRADLEKKSRGAHDMATLLRALGIPVEGGLRPSPQQVGSAASYGLTISLWSWRLSGRVQTGP
jgi:hypothetical protein